MSIRGPAGNIQHASAGFEDYTAPRIVEPSRHVLGRIDLDPASCELANTVVRAETFWTIDDPSPLADECEWGDGETTVFLNPPGGKCTPEGAPLERDREGKQNGPGESYAAWWWEKLLTEYDAGRVHSAIFICFSLNVFQNSQELGTKKAGNVRAVRPPYLFPFVVPAQRERFWRADRPVGKGAPSQPNAVVYLPPKTADTGDRFYHRECFREAFAPLGAVRL